jgi:membrane protease subunit HflK
MRYLVGAAALVLVLSLLTGVTQVQPGERAVVRRFGRVLDEKPGPGLHLGLPWGIDEVQRVPVDQIRRVSVGFSPGSENDNGLMPPGQLVTGDHNLINVQLVLDYAVDAEEVEQYVVQAEQVNVLLERVAETVLVEWAAGRRVDQVVLEKQALPDWVVRETTKRLQPYRLGVRLLSASVTHLSPPDEVKEAFANVARANTEKGTRVLEAGRDAQRRRSQAVADDDSRKKRAQADAAEQVSRGKQAAATFKDRLNKARAAGDRQAYLLAFWTLWRRDLLNSIPNSGGRIAPPFDPSLSKEPPGGQK